MREMISRDEVRAALEGLVRQYNGVQALARRWRCSRQYIYDVLRDRRYPGPLMLKKLGLRKVRIVYVHYEKV